MVGEIGKVVKLSTEQSRRITEGARRRVLPQLVESAGQQRRYVPGYIQREAELIAAQPGYRPITRHRTLVQELLAMG